MGESKNGVVISIATPLESTLVAAIAAVDDRLDVRYQPGQMSAVRDAEVLFGMPVDSPQDLADVVAQSVNLRWVQASASGASEYLRATKLTESDLTRVLFTHTGVTTTSSAEFALFGLLSFAKKLPRLIEGATEQLWNQAAMTDLAGQTLLVIGLGSTGIEVARLGSAFGMRVLGVNHTGRGKIPGVEMIRPPRFLGDLLPVSHAVVTTLPLNEATRGLIDASAIGRMRADSVLVNVGPGCVVDEAALLEGLKQGQPAGAVLSGFATHSLRADSPLWRLRNVLIGPDHVESQACRNQRIVDTFIQNLRRYLHGGDLRGVIHVASLY